MPISIDQSTNGHGGPLYTKITCEVFGPIDLDFRKLMDDLWTNKKHLIPVSDIEYATMSSDSKKLSLILQEVLELKSLIRGDEC